MSAIRSWTILCDGCDAADDLSLGWGTAQGKREWLKNSGWSVNRPGGHDLCPNCNDEGVTT